MLPNTISCRKSTSRLPGEEAYVNLQNMAENFDVVDENDNVIGRCSRAQAHGDPSLIHRVAHVLVFDNQGRYLMQKRSLTKDIQPGRWDTSVGGHVDSGETYEQAAIREMQEELGIKEIVPEFLYKYRHTNAIESEMVSTFTCRTNGPFKVQKEEIDQIRFWTQKEILKNTELFTPNFLDELARYNEFIKGKNERIT